MPIMDGNCSQKYQILLYIRDWITKLCYMVRAETEINAHMRIIVELLKDNHKVMLYDKTIKYLKVLEEKKDLWVVYTLSKKPSLLIDKRDCVTLSRYQETNGLGMFVRATIDHPDFPTKASPVRCEIPIWGWIIDPSNDTKTIITYVVLINPKGNLPINVIITYALNRQHVQKMSRDY